VKIELTTIRLASGHLIEVSWDPEMGVYLLAVLEHYGIMVLPNRGPEAYREALRMLTRLLSDL
jgi:hypothetical protein